MKKLGNTLYVTTQGAYLAKDGEAVAVRVEDETRMRVPIHLLDGVVCFGQVGASPFALGLCGERGVGVSFLTENGRFLARMQGPVSGNVLLRREQYRAADDPARSADLARAVVAAKVANARTVLQRALRDRPDAGASALRPTIEKLSLLLGSLERCPSVDEIRGLEGHAASLYFEVFDELIVQQRETFAFTTRSRRPPLDPVNALLSFLYALLRHEVESALEGVGLDPAVGFLHRDRPGRPSLALDLMEEFRAVLCDRLALSLINRRQLATSDFTTAETGGVSMSDKARKEILTAWQERKREEVLHPFLNERASIGLLFHLQAALLARFLRGDLDGYPSYFWK
jgi:CRISP-associated protein Cas1